MARLNELDVPPEVPATREELEEAMRLLGNFANSGRLRPSKLEELRALVGGVPSPEQARRWKAALKELKPEMRELDAAEKRASGRRRVVVTKRGGS